MNRKWGFDQGTATLKTPTSLLLRPDGEFDSFGYEAEEKYANFLNGEDREYLYFKHFKMALHKSEVDNYYRVPVKLKKYSTISVMNSQM